jgi:hypothetical protein
MQIFIKSEAGEHVYDRNWYSMIDKDDCSIGSAGIFHLSKAIWKKLDWLTMSKLFFIKVPMCL